MADAGLVDKVVMDVLAADATLAALCPDGVFWALAAPHQPTPTAYVIVALVDHSERPALNGETLYERTIYLVKAVMLTPGGADPGGAALRIHELLHGVELDLSPAGYAAMLSRQLERVRYTELDALNKLRWQHVGGQYEVWSYPA